MINEAIKFVQKLREKKNEDEENQESLSTWTRFVLIGKLIVTEWFLL